MNRTLFQKVPGIRHERITAQDFGHPPSGRSQMHPDAKGKLADIPIAFQTHREVVVFRKGVERKIFIELFVIENGASNDHVASMQRMEFPLATEKPLQIFRMGMM